MNLITVHLQEVKRYIDNIQLKYRDGVVISDGLRHFNSQEIVQHLKAMIPSLDLTENFKLTVKPNYLSKPICRNKAVEKNCNELNSPRSTYSSSSTSSSSVSLVSMSPAASSDIIVGPNPDVNYNAHIVLFRCDHMLTADQVQFTQDTANGINSFEDQIAEIHENDTDLDQTTNSINLNDTTVCMEFVDVNGEGSTNNYIADSQAVGSKKCVDKNHGFLSDDSDHEENAPYPVTQSNIVSPQQDGDDAPISTDKAASVHSSEICEMMSMTELPMTGSQDKTSGNEMNKSVIGNEFDPESNDTVTDENNEHQNMANLLEPVVEIEIVTQVETVTPDASDSSEAQTNLNQTNTNQSSKTAEPFDEIDIVIEQIRQTALEKELMFQSREKDQAEAYADLEQRSDREITRLTVANSELTEKCAKMQQNLDTLKTERNDQIQRAVEETKKKRWCWKCFVELPMKNPFHIPMCKKCLDANW